MRRRILDAAAGLLAERGVQAATLRDIAAAAGLKAGSIYYHFPSKDSITIDVLNEGVSLVTEAIRASLAGLPAGADGQQRLSAAFRAHLDALHAHRAYTRAAIRAWSQVPETIREDTIESRRDIDRVWLDLLADLKKDGALAPDTDEKALVIIILGALNWTIEGKGAGPAERQRVADQLLSLCLCGSADTNTQ